MRKRTLCGLLLLLYMCVGVTAKGGAAGTISATDIDDDLPTGAGGFIEHQVEVFGLGLGEWLSVENSFAEAVVESCIPPTMAQDVTADRVEFMGPVAAGGMVAVTYRIQLFDSDFPPGPNITTQAQVCTTNGAVFAAA